MRDVRTSRLRACCQIGFGAAEADGGRKRTGLQHTIGNKSNPAKATTLAKRGIEVRRGDFTDPSSPAAFAGASQVLIVSDNKLGEEALRMHRNAINAAQAAGASRVLYTSHMGACTGSPFLPADQHAGTEADLAASGMSFTALRHGFHAESCLHMIADGLEIGELRTPENGPISWPHAPT